MVGTLRIPIVLWHVQLAESWLLRLLVAAAEKHLEEHEEEGAPALLPSAPSDTTDSIG